VSPSDGDLSRVARAARLRGFLADDMILRAGSQEVASRDAIVGLVGRWSPPGAVTVEFVDARGRFDEPSRDVVYVHLTVKVSANDPRTGEQTIDAREADVQLEQRNGQWVVAQATTVDTLAR
jgi:hypothetical protein